MQTQLFWYLCKEIYIFFYMHFFICSIVLFHLKYKENVLYIRSQVTSMSWSVGYMLDV